MSKDRNVHETSVDCVGHPRKSRNVDIRVFFYYLQGRTAMNSKLGVFFILLYNLVRTKFRSVQYLTNFSEVHGEPYLGPRMNCLLI
jgi:hypothetical protein